MTRTTDLPQPHDVSERIGPYRLLQVLGEGGMGIVYEAEETESVRRRVALKVVRDRHASKEVLARFEVERQALAVMNHPGIAKVYGAGTTPHGQPYFAMELVRGLPITQYCDEHRLPLRERLELFVAVCNAVQHAHQKGLIHRDLKPSNILVTDADGAPEPKIIDFGIAKALGQQLTDMTLVTQFGHAIGTAAYMSPEQAEANAVDVDTRADIYSLGVLMYEILTGELPSDPAAVGLHVYLARLMARETDPPSPSRRLDSLRTDPAIIARARRTDIPHLRREMRGDLDWIVMKAMEPDRSRRYATAHGLGMDIGRYLANEPIVARPPSTAYRLRKFVRRNKALSSVAAVAFLAVIASTAVTSVGMVRARRAERIAASEAAAARQVTDFLVDIFRVSSPSEARGNAVTARELLDRGAARVASSLSDQPVLQARLLHTMGSVYGSLGIYGQARTLLEDALRARERLAGPNDTSVAQTLTSLGIVATNRGEFEDADRFLRRALAIREAALDAEHPDVGATLRSIGVLRLRQGRYAEAESLLVRTIRINDRRRQPDDPLVVRDLLTLTGVHQAQRRYAEAEPVMRRALAAQERALGPMHPDVGVTLTNLGALQWSLGRYRDALPLYMRARGILERSLPEGHPDLAANANNLAETYWKLGRFAEAEPLFRRALDIKERALTPTHPTLATTLNGLAGLLRDQGRFAEAEPLYRRALAIREQNFGTDDANVLETRRDYAALLRATGRGAEAEAMVPQ